MAKKAKQAAADMESIPALFTTELGVCKKVRIKDAWGTSAFIILGVVPAWVKDVKVDDYSSGNHPFKDSSLADMVKKQTEGGSLVKVKTLSPIAAIADNIAYILIKLETEREESAYIQRSFLDYIQQNYPTAHLKVAYPLIDAPKIVAYDGEKIVAFVAGVCLTAVRILSAEELLNVYKEWSNDVKGINLDSYK